MKLYMHPGSPNSRRARIAARLVQADLEEVFIDPSKGDNRTPDYLALNPMGKVPTLVRPDGRPLLESHAIAAYLTAGTAAAPEAARDDLLRWQLFDAAHFAGPLGTLTFQHLFAPEPDPAVVERALKEYRRYAAVIEAALPEGDGYLLGDAPTIADTGLAASLTYAPMSGVPLDETPRIAAWRTRLEALPALLDTAPPPRTG